jgi:hypothetical protein
MHGRYRLFPESYVGPLVYEDMPDTAPPGVVSDDIETIRTSSIYAEPSWLSEGYRLSSTDTAGYDSEHVIRAIYKGPWEPIQINRVRQFTWPIDVILPASDSATLSIFETPTLNGVPAVLYYPKPGSVVGSAQTVLSFVEGDIETTVLGDHLDRNTAISVALSLICGLSCASSRSAIPPPEPIPIPGDFLPASTIVGATDASQEGLMSLGASFTSDFADDEHRVIAGLQLTNVKALYWPELGAYWHGGSYGEAALDLQHPDGAGPTGNVPVNFASWHWSGNFRIYATAQEYRLLPSYCDGRYVELKDAGGNFLGKLTYVHLERFSQIGVNVTWPTNVGTWTIRNLGKVSTWQDPLCAWTAIHLHHGQQTASPQITYNGALPGPGGVINPTNDYVNNWMFKVTTIDSDGDGCTDSEEAVGAPPPKPGSTGAYNPRNYWDFYDVPVPANRDPTPNGPRNRAVTLGDVMAVLFYVGAADNQPPNGNGVDYDSLKDGDWNGDLVPQHVEFSGHRVADFSLPGGGQGSALEAIYRRAFARRTG